ncbi:MAG: Ig-like domain-containing protein, partial [Pseudomonadota bacterium]
MNKNLGTFSTKVFAPYLEWTLENDSISGNAYDLNASVTFTHKGTGEKITTGMFYDGDDYNFRFTGTKAGEWTFQTSSGDADLNGYSGTINVAADSDNRGFVVAENGKFAQQISDGSLEAILPNMAMMTTNIEDYYNNKAGIKNFVQTFIVEHGFTGVHIPNLGAQLFDLFSNSANYGSSFNGSQGWDPDPRAFEVLENIITEVHAAGGIVHIWPWGDNARDQTPDSMPGGENGYVHDRIMEYMADRLGALPGWTLGYGFDNYEWTTPAQAAEAARYFNSQSGWEHLTSVRGGDSVQNSANHSGETRWHEAGQTVADYEHHQPTYEMYVAAFQASDDLAVQSGDRFRVRDRSKDFTQAETVDNLWISTIAGGASGIYGNLTKPNGSTIDTNEGSLSYTQAIQNQIATWNEFFIERGRFELDSARANYLTGGASNQQYALESKSANHVVVYAEDTNSITLNLGKLSGDADWSNGATVIAVNTEAAYQQTNLGSFDLENQTISLSSKSDWALFVRANTSSSGGNNTGGGDDNSGGSTGGGSTGGNNTAPNASYDRATVVQGETVRIDVLANDSDSNGDTLTVQSVDGSPQGTVSINAAGKVVYVAPTDWSGRDTFSYTISDGNGGTDTARIDVDVSKSSSSSGDSGGSSDSGGSTNTDTTTPTDATPIYTLSQKSFSG